VRELRKAIGKDLGISDDEQMILCVDCASDAVPISLEDSKQLVKCALTTNFAVYLRIPSLHYCFPLWLFKAEYSLPHEEKELFFYNISHLRSAEALFGMEVDSDPNWDEEETLASSVGASEDFARSAGFSVVGGEGPGQASRSNSSTERLGRKYTRLCAVEKWETRSRLWIQDVYSEAMISRRVSEARYQYMDAGASEAERQVLASTLFPVFPSSLMLGTKWIVNAPIAAFSSQFASTCFHCTPCWRWQPSKAYSMTVYVIYTTIVIE
jgi:hypothetical protein